MAIAIDATTPYQVPDGGNGSVSFSHTCTGSDLVLLLAICQDTDGSETVSSGPTYNSVAMTSIGDSTLSPNGRARVRVYRLIAPATGSNTVAFGMSASGDGRTVAIARSFTGVHQTTPEGTVVVGTFDSSDPSVNVSSAADELVVDFIEMADGASTPTAGGGQTGRASQINVNGIGYGASSDETGAGTTTMSWSGGQGLDSASVAVPLKPISGGAATLEQEGYRIRNDDGSESSASWKAAQDTAVSMTLGAARVRVLLDATNDPASKAVGLKYAVNGGQKRSVN